MKVCTITKQRNKWTQVNCDYNLHFIEALKAMIPHVARQYDPITRVWSFPDTYTHEVAELAKKHFKKCSLVEVGDSTVTTTRLHTGAVERQESLFSKGGDHIDGMD